MGHIGGAAKDMSDRMAGPHRDTTDNRNHRLPGADLATQAGIHVARVGLHGRQAIYQQVQCALGHTIAEVI